MISLLRSRGDAESVCCELKRGEKRREEEREKKIDRSFEQDRRSGGFSFSLATDAKESGCKSEGFFAFSQEQARHPSSKMARVAVALIVTLIAVNCVHANDSPGPVNGNPDAFSLSSNVLFSRMLGLQLGKTIDSLNDEVANVIESTSEDVDKQSEPEVPAPAEESATQVATDAAASSSAGPIEETKSHSKSMNKPTKSKKKATGEHKDSEVHKKNERSKWLNHCENLDNESPAINHPYDVGCLFKQLHALLMKKPSFKGSKDIAKQCAKACVEVYSSETTLLTQCVQGCNLATEKQSTRTKQPVNRSKSHSKGKPDRKKVSSVKLSKKKNSVGKKGATVSPSSTDTDWIVSGSGGAVAIPPVYVPLFTMGAPETSGIESSHKISDQGKHPATAAASQMQALSNIMSSHPTQQSDWVEPLYKTPRQPFESIERLLSKSLMKSPASTFRLIKSSITLFTDNDDDSNGGAGGEGEGEQHASPLPLDDASLAQLKTTDSVYSDSSDLSLMEPRVIIFGESDQDFPAPAIENHSTKHIYKSPGRSTWHKIWECFKANIKYDYFRIAVIALCVFLLLLMYFILIDGQLLTCGCVPAFMSMFAKPVKYSRVPTSDGSIGGHKNRCNTLYQRQGSESNYENDSLLSSDDESSGSSSTSESMSCELIVGKSNRHPPSYEEAQADESRNSRSLLVAIDLPLPGNSEPDHSSNKLIV